MSLYVPALVKYKAVLYSAFHLFTSRSVRSAQTAGTKIALRFPRLFVTMQLQCIATFGGLQAKLQQMKVRSFVLPRWRKRGRQP